MFERSNRRSLNAALGFRPIAGAAKEVRNGSFLLLVLRMYART